MKNTQKFFAVKLLIIIAVLFVGGIYIYEKIRAQKTTVPRVAEPTTQQPTSSSISDSNTQASKPTSSGKSSLSLCGINVIVKSNQPVSTNTGNSGGLAWGQLIVGDPMPHSVLAVSCTAKSKNPGSEAERLMNDVSYVLGIQSSGSSKVNKSLYTVFDKQTLSSIVDLYSAKDRGYRPGSETIGFSNQDWVYTFSFLNPEEGKNQNSFVISVNQ